MNDRQANRSRQCTTGQRIPAGSPFLHEEDEGLLSLQFEPLTIQSCMRKSDPHQLMVDYTQMMIGFVLFQPAPKHIAMIGLGGGSLAKYCHKFLPEARFTAVEVHPEVIALRDRFKIPMDGPRFKVVCADGADYVRDPNDPVDVLLVDGFDLSGQPRQLCSTGFYDNCYAKLRTGGVMVVNLWSGDSTFALYGSRMLESFAGQVVIVDTEKRGNRIAFAYKGEGFPPRSAKLNKRVRNLENLHSVSLRATAERMLQRIRKRASHLGLV